MKCIVYDDFDILGCSISSQNMDCWFTSWTGSTNNCQFCWCSSLYDTILKMTRNIIVFPVDIIFWIYHIFLSFLLINILSIFDFYAYRKEYSDFTWAQYVASCSMEKIYIVLSLSYSIARINNIRRRLETSRHFHCFFSHGHILNMMEQLVLIAY